VTTEIREHRLPNGLVLLADLMPAVQSAAFNILIPAGAAHDPDNRRGLAAMLADWWTRGAGTRDSREILDALDHLGVTHAAAAGTEHLSISAATLGSNLPLSLPIFADIVLRPHLDEEELEPLRALALQGLRSLDDDPGAKVLVELRSHAFPDPWGRHAGGTVEGVEAITTADVRRYHQRHVSPEGVIMAAAGAIDWPALRDLVEQLFGDWSPRPTTALTLKPAGPARDHISRDTQQIQLALAFPEVTVAHPEYYVARAITAILGGYSSARLFTEVREKRGLCYSISAGYEGYRDRAMMMCHAGTSTERAQETLDVILAELRRLACDGVNAEELSTMRAGLKSSLIMQQESSMSRAAMLAGDWYHLGRVRSLDEIADALDALTTEAVNRHAATLPLDDLTVVTLGPKPLRLPA
jgi:predicted Zn-dependent peptidase